MVKIFHESKREVNEYPVKENSARHYPAGVLARWGLTTWMVHWPRDRAQPMLRWWRLKKTERDRHNTSTIFLTGPTIIMINYRTVIQWLVAECTTNRERVRKREREREKESESFCFFLLQYLFFLFLFVFRLYIPPNLFILAQATLGVDGLNILQRSFPLPPASIFSLGPFSPLYIHHTMDHEVGISLSNLLRAPVPPSVYRYLLFRLYSAFQIIVIKMARMVHRAYIHVCKIQRTWTHVHHLKYL